MDQLTEAVNGAASFLSKLNLAYRNDYITFRFDNLSSHKTIIPQNSSKLGGKDIQGLVFIEDQEIGLLTPIGNLGSYNSLKTALNKSKSRPQRYRKNHFFYHKVRQLCGVSRADGLCGVVPSCINEVEEQGANQQSRDYRYKINLN